MKKHSNYELTILWVIKHLDTFVQDGYAASGMHITQEGLDVLGNFQPTQDEINMVVGDMIASGELKITSGDVPQRTLH